MRSPTTAHESGCLRLWAFTALAIAACGGDLEREPATCNFVGCPDDGDPCTGERCVDGACISLPIDVELDCRRDDHCDFNACVTGTCVPVPACGFSRCTVEPNDCDDGDPCTTDSCDAETGCVHALLDGEAACLVDADCDDANACTLDACDGVVPGCALSICTHRPASDFCRTCESDADCGWRCTPARCLEGRCEEGPTDPRCDFRCFPQATLVTDGVFSDAGTAAPSGLACDDGCTCERELVLTHGGDQLALMTNERQVFAFCAVDDCAGTAQCDKMKVGRGYQVSGGFVSYGPRDPNAPTEDIGFERTLDYFCLSTQTALMLGPWRGSLTLAEETLTFDAVARASADGTATEMIVTATAAIPAQTVRLQNGGFRLDTSIESTSGTFTGPLFSGPDSIEGDVVDLNGQRGVLRFSPP